MFFFLKKIPSQSFNWNIRFVLIRQSCIVALGIDTNLNLKLDLGEEKTVFVSSLQIICTNQYRHLFIRSTLNFSDVSHSLVLHWIYLLPNYKKRIVEREQRLNIDIGYRSKLPLSHVYSQYPIQNTRADLAFACIKAIAAKNYYQINDRPINEICFWLNNCPTKLTTLPDTPEIHITKRANIRSNISIWTIKSRFNKQVIYEMLSRGSQIQMKIWAACWFDK